MDLRKLDVFNKVYELRSFSRAGEESYLSQPTVSGHIKYLEELLEVRLFDRLGREVLPTKAAEVLYKFSKRMVQLRDEAFQSLQEFSGKMQGEILVGGSTIPGNYILPRLISAFNRRYPDVRVNLHVADTQEIIRRILDIRLEVGMVGARTEEERVMYVPFMHDDLVLVTHPDGPPEKGRTLSVMDLVSLPFIMREPGSGTRLSARKTLAAVGLDLDGLRVVAEFGNTETVRQGVKAGLGVSIISDLAVREDVRNGSLRIVPVEGLPIRREFHLAIHRHRTQSPIARAFLAFCQGIEPDGLFWAQ